MPEHLVYRLRAVFTDQPDAEVRDQPAGTINGLDLQEATYVPRRELCDSVEGADANEADVLIKPVMPQVCAVHVVSLAQVNLGYRDLALWLYGAGRLWSSGVEPSHAPSFPPPPNEKVTCRGGLQD